MPAVMEQIDRMNVSEKMQTLEYLWSSMAASVVAQPPAWHAAILAERRRQYDAGEIGTMSVAESKRRLFPIRCMGRLNRLEFTPVFIRGGMIST